MTNIDVVARFLPKDLNAEQDFDILSSYGFNIREYTYSDGYAEYNDGLIECTLCYRHHDGTYHGTICRMGAYDSFSMFDAGTVSDLVVYGIAYIEKYKFDILLDRIKHAVMQSDVTLLMDSISLLDSDGCDDLISYFIENDCTREAVAILLRRKQELGGYDDVSKQLEL